MKAKTITKKLKLLSKSFPIVHTIAEWTFNAKPWQAYGLTMIEKETFIESEWPGAFGLALTNNQDLFIILEVDGGDDPGLVYIGIVENKQVEDEKISHLANLEAYKEALHGVLKRLTSYKIEN